MKQIFYRLSEFILIAFTLSVIAFSQFPCIASAETLSATNKTTGTLLSRVSNPSYEAGGNQDVIERFLINSNGTNQSFQLWEDTKLPSETLNIGDELKIKYTVLSAQAENDNFKAQKVTLVKEEVEEEKLPDLVLEDIRMTNENPKEGDWIHFEVKIKNAGNAPTGKFTVKHNGSTESRYNSIEPGEYRMFNNSQWSPMGGFKATPEYTTHLGDGKYEFTVILDYKNEIKELEKSNNEKSIVVELESPEPEKLPDLILKNLVSLTAPNSEGGNYHLEFKVKNTGKADISGNDYQGVHAIIKAPSGNIKTDTTWENPFNLQKGKAKIQNGFFKSDEPIRKGDSITIIIDTKNEITESDESNNTKTFPIKEVIGEIPEEPLDPTPRISYWQGKVNQHTEAGIWKTDPDGKSGANLNKLAYCKKWYPDTTEVKEYEKEMITDWKDRGNTNNRWSRDMYDREVISYECITGEPEPPKTELPDLIVNSLFILGKNPKDFSTNFCIKNIGNKESNPSFIKIIVNKESNFSEEYYFPGLESGKQKCRNIKILPTFNNGENFISIEADTTNEISEISEDNNKRKQVFVHKDEPIQHHRKLQTKIIETEFPDLIVDSISIRNRNQSDPSVYFCVKNKGENDSGYFDATLTANGKTDFVQKHHFTNLKPNQNYCRDEKIDPQMLRQGTNSIVIEIDPDHLITEENEENNEQKEFFVRNGNLFTTPNNTCQAYWTGYTYDSDKNTCVRQSSSGCSNPFPYKNYLTCKLKNIIPSKTNTSDDTNYEDEVITNEFEEEVLTNMYFFPDTSKTSLEGQAAAYLRTLNIIGGFPDGEFKGDREVNRAELSKFLLLGAKNVPPSVFKDLEIENLQNNGRFPDVLDGEWYVKYVIKAEELGIVNGYPDKLFRPANTVNTAEFLKMLTKTFGLDENLPYNYEDVQTYDWFKPYAGTAQKFELFPDRDPDYLEPARELTRSEVAIALYRYFRGRNVAGDNLARRYVSAEQYLDCLKQSGSCTDLKKFYNSNYSTWNSSYTQNQYDNDGLVVSNNMSDQKSVLVYDDETNVQALSLKFSTEGKSAKITGLKFRRIGNGNWSDFTSAWVTISNRNEPISDKITITGDTIEIPFNETISMNSNDAKYFILNVDLSGSGESGNDSRFVLYLPEWIESTTEVVGFFPFGGTDIEIR